jgi:hypothetical protein
VLGKARESPHHQSLVLWAGRIRLLEGFEGSSEDPLECLFGLGFPRSPASPDGPAAFDKGLDRLGACRAAFDKADVVSEKAARMAVKEAPNFGWRQR